MTETAIPPKIVNGTTYHGRTPDAVVAVLERCRADRTRIHVCYGHTDGDQAGRDWLEEHETTGRVGRSTGTSKIPLLVFNSRSLGGGSILSHCIVRIRKTSTGEVLYEHPEYHTGTLLVKRLDPPVDAGDGRKLTIAFYRDFELHAQFEDEKKLRAYLSRLGIEMDLSTLNEPARAKPPTEATEVDADVYVPVDPGLLGSSFVAREDGGTGPANTLSAHYDDDRR